MLGSLEVGRLPHHGTILEATCYGSTGIQWVARAGEGLFVCTLHACTVMRREEKEAYV